MSENEDVWTKIQAVLKKQGQMQKRLAELYPIQQLDPNKPVQVASREYLQLLQEYWATHKELEPLLEEAGKLPPEILPE